MSNTEKDERADPVRVKPEGQIHRHLSALLSDTSLRKAIVRLVHHIHKESGKEFTEQTAAECLQQLSQISFLEVPCVRTVQMKLSKAAISSQKKTLAYVHNKEGKPRESVVYLDEDACTNLNSNIDGFLHKCVSAIQFVVGVSLESLLLYRMLKAPRQADAILDEAGVEQCAVYNTFSSVNRRPGTFVPLCHLEQLDNDFHEFSEGDFVAFEVYDPLLVYENSEDSIPVYIYATVLHEIDNRGSDTVFAKRYHIDLGPDRGETEVSVTRLYKICKTTSQMKTDASSDSAQVGGTTSIQEKDDQTLDVSSVLKNLREKLTRAWQVCKEEEFRCVIKRLILKWHPDQHSSNESACTRLTEAIFRYAELLRQGEKLPEDEESAGDARDSVDGQMVRSGHPSSMTFFARSYARRLNHHARHKGTPSTENPQPGEGWRWLHTAQCDLTAARASRGICEQGRNWVCFLCHQAVEKALKGVLYLRNADNDCLQSHSLPVLARHVGDILLQQLAHQMESRMGPHTRMRYPDVLVYPNIPADVYSEEDVDVACDLGWQVLERAQCLMKEW